MSRSSPPAAPPPPEANGRGALAYASPQISEPRPDLGGAVPSPLLKLLWPLLALGLLLLIGFFSVKGFLDVSFVNHRFTGNLAAIALYSTRVMLLSLGMCLVIATGGIDLSVGAIMAVAGAAAAESVLGGLSPWLAILVALGAGLLCGLWNGVLVAILDIQPIVATLVLMVAGRGVAQLITGGQIPNFKAPVLVYLGQGVILGIPFPLILALAMLVVTVVLVRKTAVGLMIETIGENPVTARYCGIPVSTIKLLVYVFSGFCAGMAGLVDAALIQSADANNAGLYLELDAIFAVVVGGTALIGGRFYLVGAILGALLLQTLTTTILALGVPSQLIPLPKAVVIVGVILLQAPLFRKFLTRAFHAVRPPAPAGEGAVAS